MTRQLRLGLTRPASYRREDFVAGPSNRHALERLDAWPSWHLGCLTLVGPEGVGKTHLAHAWAAEVGALVLDRSRPDIESVAGRPAVVEDVDQGVEDETLFHLINMAGRPGGGLLLTARTPPAAWPCALPDLRSRLNALPVVEIAEPDDDVLEGVLRRLFRERLIEAPKDVYPYLLRRIPRSVAVAREVVRLIDETADAEQRPISRLLARQVLEGNAENLDLFE